MAWTMDIANEGSELRSLTAGSFDLFGDAPTITIEAAYAKNRRRDTLPLRTDMAK